MYVKTTLSLDFKTSNFFKHVNLLSGLVCEYSQTFSAPTVSLTVRSKRDEKGGK